MNPEFERLQATLDRIEEEKKRRQSSQLYGGVDSRLVPLLNRIQSLPSNYQTTTSLPRPLAVNPQPISTFNYSDLYNAYRAAQPAQRMTAQAQPQTLQQLARPESLYAQYAGAMPATAPPAPAQTQPGITYSPTLDSPPLARITPPPDSPSVNGPADPQELYRQYQDVTTPDPYKGMTPGDALGGGLTQENPATGIPTIAEMNDENSYIMEGDQADYQRKVDMWNNSDLAKQYNEYNQGLNPRYGRDIGADAYFRNINSQDYSKGLKSMSPELYDAWLATQSAAPGTRVWKIGAPGSPIQIGGPLIQPTPTPGLIAQPELPPPSLPDGSDGHQLPPDVIQGPPPGSSVVQWKQNPTTGAWESYNPQEKTMFGPVDGPVDYNSMSQEELFKRMNAQPDRPTDDAWGSAYDELKNSDVYSQWKKGYDDYWTLKREYLDKNAATRPTPEGYRVGADADWVKYNADESAWMNNVNQQVQADSRYAGLEPYSKTNLFQLYLADYNDPTNAALDRFKAADAYFRRFIEPGTIVAPTSGSMPPPSISNGQLITPASGVGQTPQDLYQAYGSVLNPAV